MIRRVNNSIESEILDLKFHRESRAGKVTVVLFLLYSGVGVRVVQVGHGVAIGGTVQVKSEEGEELE